MSAEFRRLDTAPSTPLRWCCRKTCGRGPFSVGSGAGEPISPNRTPTPRTPSHVPGECVHSPVRKIVAPPGGTYYPGAARLHAYRALVHRLHGVPRPGREGRYPDGVPQQTAGDGHSPRDGSGAEGMGAASGGGCHSAGGAAHQCPPDACGCWASRSIAAQAARSRNSSRGSPAASPARSMRSAASALGHRAPSGRASSPPGLATSL